MAKRKLKRPAKGSDYEIIAADNSATKGRGDLCATQPGPCQTAYDQLATKPTQPSNIDKQHPLKGDLGTAVVNGVEHKQWQYELSKGARIWYVVDDKSQQVIITRAATNHPNETK